MPVISRRMPDHCSARRLGMSRTSFVVGLILWTLVLGALYSVAARRIALERERDALLEKQQRIKGVSGQFANDQQSVAGEEGSEDLVMPPVAATQQTVNISFPSRPLPDFEFPECMGDTVSLEKMKGKHWLANFVFTRCAGPCPLMTRDISELHRRVAKSNPDFEFVTFSVDPNYDSAEVLKKYAETFQADQKRWKFVTGDETKIHDFIRRGFTQYVQPNLGDMRKPGFEVAHSNRAVLVNEDGIPVGSFIMTIPEDVVRLRRIIEGKEEFPKPGTGAMSTTNGENPAVSLTLIPVQDTGQPESDSPASEIPGDVQPSKEVKTTVPNSEDGKAEAEPGDPQSSTTPQTPQEKNSRIDQLLPAWAAKMPSINAGLNTACILLLMSGLAAIKAGHKIRHRNLMIAAFVMSTAFLICYLTYHQVLFQYTQFRGRAFVGSLLATRIYYSILIPHVVLAALVPILALRVFYLAFQERWSEHRRLARITFPVWLFVSITGVVIYGMLYHWPWPSTVASIGFAH